MKNLYLSISVFLIFIFSVIAQSPESFNYQAVMRDNGGDIIANQAMGLQFTIHQTSASGTTVYQETFNQTTNNFGLINLQIGKGSVVSGIFADIDWANDTYYLETAVDVSGGTNYASMGTSQFVSVPYAMFAKSSGDSYWKPKNDGNGIGYKAGNVGIGTLTTAPHDQLEIRMNDGDPDALNLRLNNSHPDTYSRMLFNNDQLNNLVIGLNSSNYQFGANEAFIWLFEDFDIKFGTSGTERLRIKNDGKIGIGTATPASQLQVKGGDIYLEDIGDGVIMKSPDGNCWRLTVDNSGNPVFTSITCPTN
ncbi:MAG: hypothetical protein ABFR32_05440 [Bacteroidota bacterium]